jgi:16S rRNA (guanine527-N7)-methyltransferase
MHSNERGALEQGLVALGVQPQAGATDQWLEYLALLRKWAGSYNLVAAGDLAELVPRHLLDSLTLDAFLPAGAVLDVGSGAGFPGLALAIARPAQHFCLLDSNGKKVRFLRHVVRELGLENVQVEHQRVERFSAAPEFSTITCRAYSSLLNFVTAVRPLAGPDTCLLAMKGRLLEQELDAMPAWASVVAVHPTAVPGLSAQRHIVQLSLSP